MKAQTFRRRLGFALAGMRTVWTHEASFRTQVRVAALAGVGLLVLRPGPVWVALVALATGLVLALEAANAALEHLADTVHPAIAPGIKAAKDAAAAAVMIGSLAATAVGAALVYSVLP